jgi:hypothetical protein
MESSPKCGLLAICPGLRPRNQEDGEGTLQISEEAVIDPIRGRTYNWTRWLTSSQTVVRSDWEFYRTERGHARSVCLDETDDRGEACDGFARLKENVCRILQGAPHN